MKLNWHKLKFIILSFLLFSLPIKAEEIVNINVDWAQANKHIDGKLYSLNIFSGFDPVVAANEKYHQQMSFLSPKIVRYHNNGMLDDPSRNAQSWFDYKNKTWDAKKIQASLSSWKPEGVIKLINIPGWPAWMDKDSDGILDKDEYENFAKLCADLIYIVNIQGKQAVEYWEVPNEEDDYYWVKQITDGKVQRVEDLVEVYNLVSSEMKKIDPSIKIGGPAFARRDLISQIRKFVRGTKNNLDFLSFHAYATDNLNMSDEEIYDRAQAFGSQADKLAQVLDQESPNKKIELHMNEYNISWDWKKREPRMINHKGAVFDALVMINSAKSRLDVANAWNEKDDIYGKMSNNYKLRPSAYIFNTFNKYFVEQMVNASSSNKRLVDVLAVRSQFGNSIVLVNRTNEINNAKLAFKAWKPEGNILKSLISGENLEKPIIENIDLKALDYTVMLPPHSVVVLSQQ